MKKTNYETNYGRQTINDDDIDAVIKVLKSELLTQGPQVDKFEKNYQRNLILNMFVQFQVVQQHCILPDLPWDGKKMI